MSNYTDSLLRDSSNEYEHSEMVTDNIKPPEHSATDFRPALLLSALRKKTSRIKQPKQATERFRHTLAGYLISLLRDSGPMNLDDIVILIDQVKHTLRKVDGKVYKENTRKVVLATLTGSNIFDGRDQVFYLNEEKAQHLENKTIDSIKRRMNKMKNTTSDEIPIKVSSKKLDKIVIMFEKFCNKLKTDQHYKNIIKDPIKHLTGEEDMLEAIHKLGQERLLGMLQCFVMMKPYYNSILENSSSSGNQVFEEMNDRIIKISNQLCKIEQNMSASRVQRNEELPRKRNCQE